MTIRTVRTDSPSVLVDCQAHNAENPLWHPQHRYLYWTDIPTGRMFRYYPNTGTYEQIYNGEPVGGFTIQKNGALLLFKTRGTVEIWDEGEITTVIAKILEARNTRFNDAISDPEGRVYSGIMATENNEGLLYRINTDGSYHVLVEDLLVPNGMGFCANYQYFYLTDSDRRTIYRFNYDRATGNLSNQQVHIVTPENEGVPDGMTIDESGYIWSARWDNSHIYHYNPGGKEVMRIKLPTMKVSCITFGGKNYDRLFISTAREQKNISLNKNRRSKSVRGNLFQLQVGIKGRPELLSSINFSCN